MAESTQIPSVLLTIQAWNPWPACGIYIYTCICIVYTRGFKGNLSWLPADFVLFLVPFNSVGSSKDGNFRPHDGSFAVDDETWSSHTSNFPKRPICFFEDIRWWKNNPSTQTLDLIFFKFPSWMYIACSCESKDFNTWFGAMYGLTDFENAYLEVQEQCLRAFVGMEVWNCLLHASCWYGTIGTCKSMDHFKTFKKTTSYDFGHDSWWANSVFLVLYIIDTKRSSCASDHIPSHCAHRHCGHPLVAGTDKSCAVSGWVATVNLCCPTYNRIHSHDACIELLIHIFHRCIYTYFYRYFNQCMYTRSAVYFY